MDTTIHHYIYGTSSARASGRPRLLRLLHMGPTPLHVPRPHRGPCRFLSCARIVAHTRFMPRARTVAPPPHPRACRWAHQLQQSAACRWVPLQHVQHQDLLLQYLDKTLATYVRMNWNNCNIRLKYQKNTFVAIAKHMQHLDKILATYVWNTWNTWNITLATYMYKQYPLATYVWYRWNI